MPSSAHEEFRLSKFYTNALFKTLERGQIQIAEFELIQLTVDLRFYRIPDSHAKIRPWPVTVIVHRSTRSIFAAARVTKRGFSVRSKSNFFGSDDEFASSMRTGFWVRHAGGWNVTLASAERWEKRVAKAAEREKGSDLWKELKYGKGFFEGESGQDTSNTPFTGAEQAEISARIKQARDYVRTSGELKSEQIARIETRLDHIEEASTRIGRKDWLMMFNGGILSLVLADTITPQMAQHIFMLVVHGLGHFFGYGGPPPHLPGP